MLLEPIFEPFIRSSPLSVMSRALIERALAGEVLDALFRQQAQRQYTRELLFSSVVDLMSLVVCNKYPTVRAAYRAMSPPSASSRHARPPNSGRTSENDYLGMPGAGRPAR